LQSQYGSRGRERRERKGAVMKEGDWERDENGKAKTDSLSFHFF
jgi:hypothetical protein